MIDTAVGLLAVLMWILSLLAQRSARRALEEAQAERVDAAADWCRAEEMRDHAVEILHDAMELRDRYDRGPRDA